MHQTVDFDPAILVGEEIPLERAVDALVPRSASRQVAPRHTSRSVDSGPTRGPRRRRRRPHDEPRLQHRRGRFGLLVVEPFDDGRDGPTGLLEGLRADRGEVDEAEMCQATRCTES
jgi:hypothetical protein